MVKQLISNFLLRNLFCSIRPEDVIKTEKGIIKLGNEQISTQELIGLQNEVKALENMRIWQIVNGTLRDQAMEIGFKKSTTFDDLKTCKLMLYNLDIINSIITVIKNKKIT